jgi:hypothetical protein
MAYMSPEEEMRIKTLKEQKLCRFSATSWERRFREPRPPSIHLIILRAPLGAPAVIKQMAGLSEMPAIEQTKTIPEEGEREETVSFCRLGDKGFCKISEWIIQRPKYFLKPVDVVFEGKRKAAFKPILSSGECVGD